MSNKSFIIEGNEYSFSKDKKQKGGNGAVSTICSESTNKKFVVKYFLVDKFLPRSEVGSEAYEYENTKFLERYERFKKEITFLKENKFEGVVPIVDASFPFTISENQEAYYIMPKGEQLKIGNCKLLSSYKDVLVLSKNLKAIHDAKYAHRDIKPENIIYIDGKPCFCDFGLVWNMNDKRITVLNERLGPYKIMPPELESIDPMNNKIDFRKSDLYLLSKVLWMMLKNDNDGFRGEYDRNNPKIYVDLYEQGKVDSFEYFHELMEKATKYVPDDRISDDEFIVLLEKQIAILEKNSTDDLKRLNYITETKKVYYSKSESFKIFDDIAIIANYINNVSNKIKFKISSGVSIVEINILRCSIIEEEMIISVKNESKIQKIHFKPKSLIISNVSSIIINIDNNNILKEKYVKFSNNNTSDVDFYVDDTFMILSM